MDQAPGRFCQRSCRRPGRGARRLRTLSGHSGAARQLAGAVHVTWRTVLIACLALGVALGIRGFIPADRSATPPISIPDTRFDYTLTDFDALFRDADQQVELTLSGPRLEHISAERVARLIEPVFQIGRAHV